MGLNRDLIGKTYRDTYAVTAGAIESYARATNDLNQRYLAGDAGVASPVWPVVPAFPLFMSAAKDPDLGADFLRLVHGAERHTLGAPIRPGDELVVEAVLESIDESAAGEAFTVTAKETNQDGVEVATVSGTMVIRGAPRWRERSAGSGGPAQGGSAQRRIEEADEIVFEETTTVDDDQARRYARASGDHNPIHLDPAVAKSARLPDVILHGMCSMAFAVKAAVNGLCGGDPLLVRRADVDFAKPVFLGQELTTRLWQAGDDGDVITYGFSTHQPAGVAVLRGGLIAIEKA